MADTIDQFFQQHFPIIRRKCARMLGDSAEAADVAQETFLRLCASPVAHEPPAARARWIYKTSTRLAIDRLRHLRLGVEVQAQVEGPVATSAEATIAARQWLAELAARLSEQELEAAILARVDGMTQNEVAAVMERSPRTVRRLMTAVDTACAELTRRLA